MLDAGGSTRHHLTETLPTAEEKKFVADLMREPDWIAPRESVTAS